MELDITGKWKGMKEKAAPILGVVKEHPTKALGGAALLLGLMSFMKMSSSVSSLCDTIREGKKK